MAAGVTIKHKRKAGAFTGGQLAAGEWGLDVTNNFWYYSTDGSTVTQFSGGAGTVDTANSPNANEFARFTDNNTIEGRTVSETKTDLALENVTNESKATMFTNPAFTGNPTAPTPSAGDSDTSVATTAFVQGEIASATLGIQKRSTVRTCSTGNITIGTALNNGDTLNGVTLVTDDLVLVKNQTAPEENGVYVVAASPSRSPQFDSFNEHPGAIIHVQEGTVDADAVYHCTANTGGTLGTTAINFAKMNIAGELFASNNLSDLNNASTARSNLGANDAANLTTGDVATARMQTNVAAALDASGSATVDNANLTIDGGTI